MRYRLMASYLGASYQAAVGPSDRDVTLFAAPPPPEEHGFSPAPGGIWRKQVRLDDLDGLWESRPIGSYHGEPCLVLDDLGDRLHIVYLGMDERRAAQLGYWEVDRGVFEVVVVRHDVTDLAEERHEFPISLLLSALPRAIGAGDSGGGAGAGAMTAAIGPASGGALRWPRCRRPPGRVEPGAGGGWNGQGTAQPAVRGQLPPGGTAQLPPGTMSQPAAAGQQRPAAYQNPAAGLPAGAGMPQSAGAPAMLGAPQLPVGPQAPGMQQRQLRRCSRRRHAAGSGDAAGARPRAKRAWRATADGGRGASGRDAASRGIAGSRAAVRTPAWPGAVLHRRRALPPASAAASRTAVGPVAYWPHSRPHRPSRRARRRRTRSRLSAAAAWHGSPAPDGNGTWYYQPAFDPQRGGVAPGGFAGNGIAQNGYPQQTGTQNATNSKPRTQNAYQQQTQGGTQNGYPQQALGGTQNGYPQQTQGATQNGYPQAPAVRRTVTRSRPRRRANGYPQAPAAAQTSYPQQDQAAAQNGYPQPEQGTAQTGYPAAGPGHRAEHAARWPGRRPAVRAGRRAPDRVPAGGAAPDGRTTAGTAPGLPAAGQAALASQAMPMAQSLQVTQAMPPAPLGQQAVQAAPQTTFPPAAAPGGVARGTAGLPGGTGVSDSGRMTALGPAAGVRPAGAGYGEHVRAAGSRSSDAWPPRCPACRSPLRSGPVSQAVALPHPRWPRHRT